MAASTAPTVSAQLTALTAWVQAVCVEHKVEDAHGLLDGAALFEVLAGVYAEQHGIRNETVDIQAAKARPPNDQELVKLLRLVVGLVVRSEDNNEHVNAMQSLAYDDQVTMMSIVESVLADVPQSPPLEAATTPAVPDQAAQEIEALQRDLERANKSYQAQHERLVTVEADLQRVQEEHHRLDQLVASLRDVERERDALQDQQDEWKHMAEQSKKQARQLDVLRDRTEKAADLRRQVKELESRNSELATALADATDRSASDLMEKHRSAHRLSERKYAQLEEAHEMLVHERDTLEARCYKLEEQRRTDQKQLDTLLERIRTLELDAGVLVPTLAEETSDSLSFALPDRTDPRDMQAEGWDEQATSSAHQHGGWERHVSSPSTDTHQRTTSTDSTQDATKWERECYALRQELRLMASAYQKLSLELYCQSSGIHDTDMASEEPAQNASWLSRQRDALAHALSLSKPP
ncbi:hypothetical protein MEQU1_003066 [Malassezia equina]|uniref:HOOK N-terminal domain-containing protein n=1 Tax=Malassezia equina TaxID=1381935 RepID=A0AAF0J058_9BASI|nr:hypothetical protein MEQU1_003066 [Malassezia equina]